jgi:hypothetical protein
MKSRCEWTRTASSMTQAQIKSAPSERPLLWMALLGCAECGNWQHADVPSWVEHQSSLSDVSSVVLDVDYVR